MTLVSEHYLVGRLRLALQRQPEKISNGCLSCSLVDVF